MLVDAVDRERRPSNGSRRAGRALGRPSGAPRSRAPSGGTRSRTCWSPVQVQHVGVGVGRRRASRPVAAALASSQSGSPSGRRGARGRSTSATTARASARRRSTNGAWCRCGARASRRPTPDTTAPRASGSSAARRVGERARLLGDDREVVGVVHRRAAYEKSVCGRFGLDALDELGAVVVGAVHHRAHRPELDRRRRARVRAAARARARSSMRGSSQRVPRVLGEHHRHAVVDRRHRRVRARRHDRAREQPRRVRHVVVPPDLPEPGERDRLAVAAVDEHRLLLLAARHRAATRRTRRPGGCSGACETRS